MSKISFYFPKVVYYLIFQKKKKLGDIIILLSGSHGVWSSKVVPPIYLDTQREKDKVAYGFWYRNQTLIFLLDSQAPTL